MLIREQLKTNIRLNLSLRKTSEINTEFSLITSCKYTSFERNLTKITHIPT